MGGSGMVMSVSGLVMRGYGWFWVVMRGYGLVTGGYRYFWGVRGWIWLVLCWF